MVIARMRGPESEAAKALQELERRRAAGEEVIVVSMRGRWHVAPADELSEMANDHSTRSRRTARENVEMRAAAQRSRRQR